MTETQKNTQNKFNKSFVYAIRSPHTDKFYVGSTAQLLCNRWSNHTSSFKRYQNKKSNGYCSSYTIMLLGDAYIELLEDINVDNRQQLTKREGEIQRSFKELCVNNNVAGRTMKEYYADNVETYAQYYADNAPQKRAYQNEYDKRPAVIERKREYNKKAYIKRKNAKDLSSPTYKKDNAVIATVPRVPHIDEPLSDACASACACAVAASSDAFCASAPIPLSAIDCE